MSAFERLQEALALTLRVPAENITETAKDTDIPTWDSLGHVNVMMTLEQTFDLTLDVEDFPRLTSVPAIIAYLRTHGIS